MKVQVFIWLTLLMISCQSKNQKDKIVKSNDNLQQAISTSRPSPDALTVDTSLIAFLPSNGLYPFEETTTATLDKEELKLVESFLIQSVNTYNSKQEKLFQTLKKKDPNGNFSKRNFLINLTQYKRQYVTILNAQGQKEVWINCLCHGDFEWRHQIVRVHDGGKCFFNLKINLNQKKYYDFSVNRSV
mgnify:CR=1 FL=1